MNRAERQERNERIAAQVREGRSFSDIATEMGLSAQTVRLVAIEAGAYVPRGYRHGADGERRRDDRKRERDERIASEVRSGRSFEDVAGELGLSAVTVRRVATAMGAYEPHGHGHGGSGRLSSRNEDILEMIRQGHTYDEAGEKHGITRERVRQIVKAYGEDGIQDEKMRNRERARRLDDERRRAIVEDAAERGLTSTQLAAEHGFSPKYWEDVARRNGVRIITENGNLMRVPSAVIAERDRQICEYLQEGHTQLEACDRFGLNQTNISRIAHKHGIRRYPLDERMTERNIRIVAEVEAGRPVEEIAKELGLRAAWVSTIVREAKICPPLRRRWDADATDERNALIATRVSEGRSFPEIAEEVGLSKGYVRRLATEMGVYEPKPREASGRPRAPRVTKEERDARNEGILESVRQGHTYEEAARAFGVSPMTVGNVVRGHGRTEVVAAQRRSREEGLRRIIEDAAKRGLTSTQVAEEHGRTPAYWERVARQNGVRIITRNGNLMRKSAEDVAARNAKVCRYLDEGHTQKEASAKFGLSESYVGKIAVTNGIRRNGTSESRRMRDEGIVADIASGMSACEVARRHHVSTQTVYKVLARERQGKAHDGEQ